MAKRRPTHIKINQEDKLKMDRLRMNMGNREGRSKPISQQEFNRRTLNIPNLDNVLFRDAAAKRRLRKLGLTGQMISVFIMLGVLMFILVSFWIWGLVGPQLADTLGDVSTVFTDEYSGNTDIPGINQSVQVGFVNIAPAFQNLQWISYTLLVFLFIGFFFLAFFVRTYPFMVIFWIGGMIVLVFASIFMSAAYNDMRSNSETGELYKSWETNDFIMSHLPHIFTVVGFIGGFILFILANRDGDAEATPF